MKSKLKQMLKISTTVSESIFIISTVFMILLLTKTSNAILKKTLDLHKGKYSITTRHSIFHTITWDSHNRTICRSMVIVSYEFDSKDYRSKVCVFANISMRCFHHRSSAALLYLSLNVFFFDDEKIVFTIQNREALAPSPLEQPSQYPNPM